MKKPLSELSIVELAAVICDLLQKEGVQTTLSGGACAEIYSNAKYVTGDLDFVVNYLWPENDKKIEQVMTFLGFEKRVSREKSSLKQDIRGGKK